MIGFLPALLLGLGSAGAVAGMGEYATGNARKEKEDAESAKRLWGELKGSADKGDWETVDALIPQLQHIIPPDELNIARTKAHSIAGQIYRSDVESGIPPSVRMPPNYLENIIKSQQPQTARVQPTGAAQPEQTYSPEGLSAIGSQINQLGEQARELPLGERGPLVEQRGLLIDEESRLTGMRPQLTEAPAPQEAPLAYPGSSRTATGPLIKIPMNRPSVNRTVQGPVGSQQTTFPGITDKDAVAAGYSDARKLDIPPHQVRAAFDVANAERAAVNQPAIDDSLINAADTAYQLEYFEKAMNQTRMGLEQQGMDPLSAMAKAAQITYDVTGLYPEKYKDLIKPKEGDLATRAFHRAVDHAKDAIPQQLEIMRAAKNVEGMKGAMAPGFLSRIIDQDPQITPTDATRAKEETAATFAQRLVPQLKQQFPGHTDAQYAAKAMQMGAYAVDGVVPREWFPAVVNDPKIFGFSEQMASVMSALKINPFDVDAGARTQDAMSQMQLTEDYHKAVMAKVATPEGAAAVYDQFQQERQQKKPPAPATQPAAPAGAAGARPPSVLPPGELDRAIQLQQKGAIEEQQKTIERKHAVAPPTLLKDLKVIDDLHRTSIQLQQLVSKKDKDGLTFMDKYGDVPSIVFSSLKNIQQYFGQVPEDVARYAAIMGKSFNIEKKEITGTASMSRERKDLLTFMPSADENVRSAMQKMVELYRSTGTELDRDLAMAMHDYPASDWEQFYFLKVKAQREKEKAAKEKK